MARSRKEMVAHWMFELFRCTKAFFLLGVWHRDSSCPKEKMELPPQQSAKATVSFLSFLVPCCLVVRSSWNLSLNLLCYGGSFPVLYDVVDDADGVRWWPTSERLSSILFFVV